MNEKKCLIDYKSTCENYNGYDNFDIDEARGLRKADRAIGTVPLSDRVNINSSSSKNGQGNTSINLILIE